MQNIWLLELLIRHVRMLIIIPKLIIHFATEQLQHVTHSMQVVKESERGPSASLLYSAHLPVV